MINKRAIGFQIRALNNLIKRDVERTHPSELDRTKGVHGWAIGYFYKNRDRDIFQRDFEEHFSIRRSTATGILQLMEKNGLIVRESVESDKRLKKIVLTEKAIEVHNIIIKDIEEREERLSRNLTEQELNTFFEIVDKIKANLEDCND